jgi:DNA-binding MarR family transcriptional regulator
MTKVLANLVERGLVVRTAHPSDRRQAIMTITGAGVALLDDERRSRNAWLTRHLATLSPDERALLRDVVPILDKLAELDKLALQ